MKKSLCDRNGVRYGARYRGVQEMVCNVVGIVITSCLALGTAQATELKQKL